jgi:hypothetical protein
VPQLVTSVCVFTHSLLQTVSLFSQAVAQAPATHASPLPHATPHLPQLMGSSSSTVHAPLQATSPAVHVIAQAPRWQYWPAGQLLLQAPQFWLSDWRFAHVAPHSFEPLGQPV